MTYSIWRNVTGFIELRFQRGETRLQRNITIREEVDSGTERS